MEFLQRLAQQIRQIYAGMSPTWRAILVPVALLMVLGAVMVGYFSQRQSGFVVLNTYPTQEEAADAKKFLDDKGVIYQLSGTTILVPADKAEGLRLDLAGQNLSGGTGKGLDAIEDAPFGTTPFTQNILYVRALQNELNKTISKIDPVVSARVLISRPDPSPFIRDKKPTTASIQVTLRPGKSLSRSQASSIIALAARSVEGLVPEAVTLVDDHGRNYSEPPGESAGILAWQLDYRNAIENHLAAKAEELLTRTLGPGKAIVKVTADIDFKRLKETRKLYGDTKQVLKERITSSKSTGVSPTARGPVGAVANIPGVGPGGRVAAGGTQGAPTSSQDDTSEIDYGVPETVQIYENNLGTIRGLSVAAMVDLTPEMQEDDKLGEQLKPTKLTLNGAQDLIQQAVGFKQDRDAIKVTDVILPTLKLKIPEPKDPRWEYFLTAVRNASLGVAAISALILCWLFLRNLRPVFAVPPSLETQEAERERDRFASIAKHNPEFLARLLETWLEQPEPTPTPPPTPS